MTQIVWCLLVIVGYSIIKRWKEEIFEKSSLRDEIRKQMKERDSRKESNQKDIEDALANLTLKEKQYAGAFYVYPSNVFMPSLQHRYTSNVDNHSLKAGFSPEEIFEIHG
jgi:hypothetical protein